MTMSATMRNNDAADSFVIRELPPTEIDACHAFFDRLEPRDVRLRFASTRFSIGDFIPVLGGWGHGFALAALDREGAIVGIASLVPFDSGEAETALIVRSDRKRRGIGRALLAAIIDRAARAGVSEIFGLVDWENKPMAALARAMEFQIVRQDSFSIVTRRRLGGRAPRH
jgi:acetyltransferase